MINNKNLFFAIFATTLSCSTSCNYLDNTQSYTTINLKEHVNKELKRQLSELFSNKKEIAKRTKKYEQNISNKVNREIRRQLFANSKNRLKSKVYTKAKRVAPDLLADKVFIYKTPKWPFYSLPFLQKGVVQIDATFDFATDSFASDGDKQDLSKLIFGEKDIQLQDILLVSKLMKSGVLNVAADAEYFNTLADQPIIFDASNNKQSVALRFARHFNQGNITLGFGIPIVRSENKIKLSSSISSAKRSSMPATFSQRHHDLQTFVEQILEEKNISFNKKDSEYGLGDLSAFLNLEINWHRAERFITGVNFVFPTSPNIDEKKLWHPQLGNGGFNQVAAFASVLFSEKRFLNPHFLAQVKFSAPGNVNRRIPKLISRADITGGSAVGVMAFGQYAIPNLPFENEPETTMRGLAGSVQKVKIRPSPELWFRVGNMLERFGWKNAFLDVYYDFRLKGRDYLGFWIHSDKYDTSFLNNNTAQIEHKLGLNFSNQYDEHFRLNLGGFFTFAGKNVAKFFQINSSLNIEF